MKETQTYAKTTIVCDGCDEEDPICDICDSEFGDTETIYCDGCGKHRCSDCMKKDEDEDKAEE